MNMKGVFLNVKLIHFNQKSLC